jgi:branched-subunit amino acid ABC-type transport system permease component
MSDLVGTAVVILVSLGVVSLMLVARLRGGGLSPQRTSMVLAQLWLTIGVIIALFVVISSVLGTPGVSGGMSIELEDIGHRFAALSVESKSLIIVAAVLALGLFAHLIYSLGRAMRAARPP